MLHLIADAMDIGKNIEAVYQNDVWSRNIIELS